MSASPRVSTPQLRPSNGVGISQPTDQPLPGSVDALYPTTSLGTGNVDLSYLHIPPEILLNEERTRAQLGAEEKKEHPSESSPRVVEREKSCAAAKQKHKKRERAAFVPVCPPVGVHIAKVNGELKHTMAVSPDTEAKNEAKADSDAKSSEVEADEKVVDVTSTVVKQVEFMMSFNTPDQRSFSMNEPARLYKVKRYTMNHDQSAGYANGELTVLLQACTINYLRQFMWLRFDNDAAAMQQVLSVAIAEALKSYNITDDIIAQHVEYAPQYVIEQYHRMFQLKLLAAKKETEQIELIEAMSSRRGASSMHEALVVLTDYQTFGHALEGYSATIPNQFMRYFLNLYYWFLYYLLKLERTLPYVFVLFTLLLLSTIVFVLYPDPTVDPPWKDGILVSITRFCLSPYVGINEWYQFYHNQVGYIYNLIDEIVIGEDDRNFATRWWKPRKHFISAAFDLHWPVVHKFCRSYYDELYRTFSTCGYLGLHYMTELSNAFMHALNGNIDISIEAAVDRTVKFKEHATIRPRYNKKPRPLKEACVTAGFSSGPYSPVCFPNTKQNQESALYSRVLKETPVPDATMIQEHNKFVSQNYRDLLGVFNVKSLSFEEYLRGSNATDSVKQVLRLEHLRLQQCNIDENSILSKSDLNKATIRKSFVKNETLLYRSVLGLKDKSPRLIQGAEATFIVLVGPWIAAMQKRVKKRWGLKSQILFTSSHSSENVAQFITDCPPDYVVLEDDVSAWDSSVSEGLCKCELSICKRMGCPRAVYDLMRANIRTRGKTADFSYTTRGTRKSGDPYTSVFNSFLNATVHLFIYKHHNGLGKYRTWKGFVKMAVQGDDNLLRYKSLGEEIDWKSYMKQMGFKAQAIFRQDLSTAEFCSTIYIPGSKPDFVPKTGKLLAKMCYFINPPTNVPIKDMVRSVAYANLTLAGNNPIISMVCTRLMELTEGSQIIPIKRFEWQMNHCSRICVHQHIIDRYYVGAITSAKLQTSVRQMKLGDSFSLLFENLIFDRDTSGPQLVYGPLTEKKLAFTASANAEVLQEIRSYETNFPDLKSESI